MESLDHPAGQAVRFAEEGEGSGPIAPQHAIVIADPDRSVSGLGKCARDRGCVRIEVLELPGIAIPAAQAIYSLGSDTSDPDSLPAVLEEPENLVRPQTVARRVYSFGLGQRERFDRDGRKPS